MEFRIADTFTDSLAKLIGDERKAAKTTTFDLQAGGHACSWPLSASGTAWTTLRERRVALARGSKAAWTE